MNPNFQHAQAIPGISDGRGIGLIGARDLCFLTDGLALIAGSPAWPEADARAMTAWLEKFHAWLTTSQNGRDEFAEPNNHGTWCAATGMALALALGKRDEARALALAVRDQRLAQQIEPDGAQPRELARTNSLGYSLFNLEALVQVARLAEHVGVDLWGHATADGRSLRAALRYLAPYIDPAKKWPKRDIHPGDTSRLLPLFAEALRHGDDPQFRSLLEKFSTAETAAARWLLTGRAPAP
jgi:hypothetical protein